MVKSSAPPTAAVVVGREQTGLGTLRSLHLAGIPAYVACPRGDLATRSRWYRPTPGAVSWSGDLGELGLEALRRMPLDRCVLIPGRDDAALWAADIPASSVAERVLVSSSTRSTLEILQDKSRFGEFLSRTTIQHPRTFTIRGWDDIAAIPFDELDRVFAKPADSQSFMRATGVKGFWARDREEFEAIWSRLASSKLAVIAQEHIPGGADQHYFIDGFRDRHGNLPALFARRRVRISPPDFGSSSYCVSVPLEEVAGALPGLTELLERLRYRGIFSAEFKRDARDGIFRILEVNTRAWWYVEFAARCGVNVVEMAWRDAQDLPIAATTNKYAIGEGCVNLPNDIAAVFARNRNGRTPPLVALGQWSRAYFNVFHIADPMPGLQTAWQTTRGSWGRKWRRLFPDRSVKSPANAVESMPILGQDDEDTMQSAQ